MDIYAYAALGLRLHPCRPRGKEPLLQNWPARATTDRATLAEWSERWPGCNWAIACGPESGVFVLDIDGYVGLGLLGLLQSENEPLPDAGPQQRTGRGSQLFFAYPPGRAIRNRKLETEIETRGAGGYVLVPPSIHPTGARYRWEAGRSIVDVLPPEAPGWLLDLADPPPPAQPVDGPRRVFSRPNRNGADSYALAALETELDATAGAQPGARNYQLNRSAFALFRLVASKHLDAATVVDGLRDAARHAGLSDHEITKTLRSAADSRGVKL